MGKTSHIFAEAPSPSSILLASQNSTSTYWGGTFEPFFNSIFLSAVLLLKNDTLSTKLGFADCIPNLP